jgi:hypothetical protein
MRLAAAAAIGVGGGRLLSGGPAAAREVGRDSSLLTGTVVYASNFGFDPSDSTDALQQALDSSADTVVVDDVGAEWLTRPLNINRDDICVVVMPGVTVRAKPRGYPNGGDCLLRMAGRSGVSLIGYGATVAMNKQEYIDLNDGSQWRHALNITSCAGVRVEGLRITGAGGDGIYLGRVQDAAYATCSSDAAIVNVQCDDNYRNGLSIISVDGLLVEGSYFIENVGHNPQAGIDFEPNLSDEQLTNIVVRDCTLEDNYNYALVVSTGHLAGATTPVSILFDRIRIGAQQTRTPSFLYGPPPADDPGGSIEVRDSLIQNAPYSGNLSAWSKNASGASLTFTRLVSIDWGNTFDTYEPWSLLGLTVADFGGITWNDCLLVTDQQTPFLAVQKERAENPGVRALHGNVTVVDPYGVTMDLGVNPTDVTLEVRALTEAPATTVTVQAFRSSVVRGAPATFCLTRTSPDLAAPLAVRYGLSGTARNRFDIDGSAGVVVIPPGAASARIELPTRRLPVDQQDGDKAVTVTLMPMESYALGPQTGATVTITN